MAKVTIEILDRGDDIVNFSVEFDPVVHPDDELTAAQVAAMEMVEIWKETHDMDILAIHEEEEENEFLEEEDEEENEEDEEQEN